MEFLVLDLTFAILALGIVCSPWSTREMPSATQPAQ